MTDLEILEQKAIEAAVASNWPEAIKINKKILRLNRKNLSTLLRLAFAHLQSRQLKEAKKIYRRVLKIQPANLVAKENLERIKILEEKKIKQTKKNIPLYNPDLFLEIAGKTKTVKLVNLGQKNILAQLVLGQEVVLKTKKRKVEVRTKDGDYIGSLPDDLSKRLRLFIKAKSVYSAYIKENSLNNLVVFIKEEKKGKKVANFISFPVDLKQKINQIDEEVQKEEITTEEESDDSELELDIEKIAESLSSEEKPPIPVEVEEESEEEE